MMVEGVIQDMLEFIGIHLQEQAHGLKWVVI